MASHRPRYGGSSRLPSPALDVMQSTSGRLPTRTSTSTSSSSNAELNSSSKLVKKRPSTNRAPAIPTMNYRSPSSGGVRRVTGPELRKELESASMSTQSRYDNALTSPPSAQSRSSSRPPLSEPARTPSLVSGSSASTRGSPRSNRLRRKHSNVGERQVRISPETPISREDSRQGYKDPYPDAVLGVAMPPVSSAYPPTHAHDDVIHLDQYIVAQMDPSGDGLTHPAPLYAMSTSTPSTAYSPGPFSISSTPTSISSASPGFVTSTASRIKHPSPIKSRAPTSRTNNEDGNTNARLRGLTPVRESSSSSTSTLRGGEGNRSRSKSRVKPLPAVSPSPPPETLASSHHRRSSSGTRPTVASSTTANSGQVLPEFAHLVDSSPRKGSTGSIQPPIRPSRDGAPDLFVQQRSPVVQSNMTSLPTSSHRRQSSAEVKRAIPTLTLDTNKPRFGLPRTRTVSPSPSQGSALSPRSAAPPTRGFTPDYPSESEGSTKIRPSPTISSKPFSRFGFFSKKDKTEASTTAAAKEKKIRKGPAAGTGHEGYGRFNIRGRSSSTASSSGNTNIGRTPSADSAIGNVPPRSRKNSFGSKNGSNSDFEDFLAEREKPIAIRGGQAANRPTIQRSQTEGPQAYDDGTGSTQFVAPSWNSSEGSLDAPRRPVLLPSLMSDPQMLSSPMKKVQTVQAQKEEKNMLPSLSSLTSRRTSRRSFLGGKALAMAQQAEIVDPSQERKGSQSSELGQQINTMLGDVQNSLKPPSKWNFLQRAKSPGRQATPAAIMDPLPAARPSTQRSMAHYAMFGESQKSLDADDLVKIMQEAENSTPEDASNSETEQKLRARKKGKAAMRHGHSILLPDPPKLPLQTRTKRSASPKVDLNVAAPLPQKTLPQQPEIPPAPSAQPISIVGQPRPSRLPQVGRIPRVVSKRDRERKLPDNSFSRPFQPTQPSPALKNGPLSPSVSSPESIQNGFAAIPDLAMASATAGLRSSGESMSPPFKFPNFVRKDSTQSSRSSASAYFNILATTAEIPLPDAPFSDDEIWGEYDDLEDIFGSRLKQPKTPVTSSSLGAPFQYAEMSPKDAVTIDRPATAPSASVEAPPEVPKVPTLASIAHQIRIPSMHDSRFVSGLPSAGSPHSPFRMSDFVGSYGERNLSMIGSVNGRLSLKPSNGRLSSSSTNGRYSLPATIRPQSQEQGQTLPSTKHTPTKSTSSGRDSRIMERAETEYMGFENLANLRFGALMTSKWLSFGRVLFSPAHLELATKGEHRVLVLDGLGKDWSFYVALNYPSASVYNLGSEETSGQAADATPIQSLPNHRHIHHPSLKDPFPFPKGFFAVVVFRFPVATTESAYKSAIFECKRVLRPGGYLEISALDMDMMNMGSRARSALRGLKTQIQAEDSSVSLKPLSDTFQKLLYRRGFENLNRCFVGIPAAGRIPGSRDEGNTPEPQSASVESSAGSSKRMDDDMPSFGDLFLSQGQAGDEGVTKMVSKVGRWWYSRCYESLILPDGDLAKSIWTDQALVRECEKKSTNLKLMICYAQKPECPVRRTISV